MFKFATNSIPSKMLLSAAGVLLAATITTAAEPTLRADVEVRGDLVRVSDLVSNAGETADTPIFRSPDLGHSGTVAVGDVLTALRTAGLTGVDTAGLNAITVARPATKILKDDVLRVLREQLVDRMSDADMDSLTIQLDQSLPKLSAAAQSLAPLTVARLSFMPKSGRFQAVIRVDDGTASGKNLRVRGIGYKSIEIDVLARRVTRGEILRVADVMSKRVPASQVAGMSVSDLADVIGLQARRNIQAGMPLIAKDFVRPMLVKRGDLINLSFTAPGILLSVRGRALVQGGRDDVISVLNLQSNRVVQAVVSGARQARITSPLGQLAQVVEN